MLAVQTAKMSVSICERCDRKVIEYELGGCKVLTCPSCGSQDPSVTTRDEDHFRMVMQCIAMGLIFLSMGNMDGSAFVPIPEEVEEKRRQLRAKYVSTIRATIAASEQKFISTPHMRKRGLRNKDAQVYEDIACQNDKIISKLSKDPDYRAKRREIWKVLGAFTGEVDGQTVMLVFALGANSHLGEIHPQARTSLAVQNYYLPLIIGVDQLSM